VALDIPDEFRDLLDAPVATFATIDGAGQPQLTEVWFLHENGDVRLSFNTDRAKTANLRARPGCSLLILDLANPMRYVEIRGEARIEPDDDYAFAQRVGEKYDADLRQYDAPDASRIVVTIEPSRVHTVDMSG
jgi:PPOX class probable F420-dependent enzyme